MLLTKLKVASLFVLAVAAVVAGAGVTGYRTFAADQDRTRQAETREAEKPKDRDKPRPADGDNDGVVLFANVRAGTYLLMETTVPEHVAPPAAVAVDLASGPVNDVVVKKDGAITSPCSIRSSPGAER